MISIFCRSPTQRELMGASGEFFMPKRVSSSCTRCRACR